MRNRARLRTRRAILIALTLTLVAISSIFFGIVSSNPNADQLPKSDDAEKTTSPLFVYFLDVRLGSSTIIDIGDREIIIDGGTGGQLRTFLREHPDIVQDPIELVVLTQPSGNSWSGLNFLFAPAKDERSAQTPDFGVSEFWDPGFDRPRVARPGQEDEPKESAYSKFIKGVSTVVPADSIKSPLAQFHQPATRSGEVKPFQIPSIPEATFTLLSSESNPEKPTELSPGLIDTFRTNNSSVVLMLEVQGIRLLFPGAVWGKQSADPPGNAPKYVEGKLLGLERNHPGTLKSDILLVPKNGSELSSTSQFIQAVSPRIAVFAANPLLQNPKATVISRYEKISHVFSTGVHLEPGVDHVFCTNSDEFGETPTAELRCVYGASQPRSDSQLEEEDDFQVPGWQFDLWRGQSRDGHPITMTDIKRYLREPLDAKPDNDDERVLKGLNGLTGADLGGIDLQKRNLAGRNLTRADLSWSDMSGANLTGTILTNANLSHSFIDSTTTLAGADLSDTDLSSARLPKNLRGTILSGAFLNGLDLRNAILVDGKLDGVHLKGADLTAAVFEPQPGSIPSHTELTAPTTPYLKTLRFETSPHALVELREAFKKAGLREQEREITYAIERERNAKRGRGFEYWFNRVLFDLTSQYGMATNRPLKVLALSILFFAIPYTIALFSRGKGAIWAVWFSERVEKISAEESAPRRLTTEFTWSRLRVLGDLGRWTRVLFVGLYFSVISAFQLGYRDFNIGSWLLRLQPREYTLRATGWVRVVSGIQSLVSVYLLALWVLIYFGRPFD